MGILWRLMGVEEAAEGDSSASGMLSGLTEWILNNLADLMGVVMPIVLAVVLAMGVFFCLKLGIAYAKTEKTEDREEAKKRLVAAVVGFGIGIIGAVVMWILFTNQDIITGIFA